MRYHGRMSYCDAIRAGFHYLLANHPEVFAIGQGLWSPWYVGNTMLGLDHEFGRDRIIDCPVSELATTGAGVGASLFGYRPIVIHPRMDFMMLASDAMVNQAAKWRHMLGGAASPAVTVRGIINRGGEQGAQHSQALHSWYAHIPGLRVVMPATPVDARDLLIQATLCNDPVLYIDDRWLYDVEDELPEIEERPLGMEQPRVLREGRDVTLVGAGHATQLCLEAAATLAVKGCGPRWSISACSTPSIPLPSSPRSPRPAGWSPSTAAGGPAVWRARSSPPSARNLILAAGAPRRGGLPCRMRRRQPPSLSRRLITPRRAMSSRRPKKSLPPCRRNEGGS